MIITGALYVYLYCYQLSTLWVMVQNRQTSDLNIRYVLGDPSFVNTGCDETRSSQHFTVSVLRVQKPYPCPYDKIVTTGSTRQTGRIM